MCIHEMHYTLHFVCVCVPISARIFAWCIASSFKIVFWVFVPVIAQKVLNQSSWNFRIVILQKHQIMGNLNKKWAESWKLNLRFSGLKSLKLCIFVFATKPKWKILYFAVLNKHQAYYQIYLAVYYLLLLMRASKWTENSMEYQKFSLLMKLQKAIKRILNHLHRT